MKELAGLGEHLLNIKKTFYFGQLNRGIFK